jgi:hypothetical protein
VLTSEEKQVLEALREPHDADGNNFSGDEDFGFGVLDGSETVDISHAGGEFHELTREVLGDFWNQWVNLCSHIFKYLPKMIRNQAKSRTRQPDSRTRHDRTRRRTDAFDKQMSALREAYMTWHLTDGNDNQGFFGRYAKSPAEDSAAGTITIKVVDIFRKLWGSMTDLVRLFADYT